MKKLQLVTIFIIIMMNLFACKPSTSQSYSLSELRELYADVSNNFERLTPRVIQPAEGYLKYPYLIPAGFYKQMWDWDGFFMANHLISQGKPEYMKYWALNLIEGVDEEGYVSGCANTKGPRPIFGKFSMKPFLSQGVFLYSQNVDDFEWIRSYYQGLVRVIDYRERVQQDTETGLFFWDNAMQSGADNNPAMNYFTDDKRKFLSCDASAWQYREYMAQAHIAERLGYQEDAQTYYTKAAELKQAINDILWNDEDEVLYNVDAETGKHYKRVSYASFVPLISHILPQSRAEAMINRYLINEKEMKALYGLRTLSIQDPDYNNKNIIVPFSNWQGPVWPIANYIYSIGLYNYGYDEDLVWLGHTLGNLLLNDIKKWDTMHENYHADTGEPLAPAHSHVDENGKIVGFISWNLCIQNVLDGIVNDNWMTLDVESR